MRFVTAAIKAPMAARTTFSSFYAGAMTEPALTTGVHFSLLEKSLTKEFLGHFPAYVDGLVRGDPGGFVLTKKYADKADAFYRMPLRHDDVWVVTFPKCGKQKPLT